MQDVRSSIQMIPTVKALCEFDRRKSWLQIYTRQRVLLRSRRIGLMDSAQDWSDDRFVNWLELQAHVGN